MVPERGRLWKGQFSWKLLPRGVSETKALAVFGTPVGPEIAVSATLASAESAVSGVEHVCPADARSAIRGYVVGRTPKGGIAVGIFCRGSVEAVSALKRWVVRHFWPRRFETPQYRSISKCELTESAFRDRLVEIVLEKTLQSGPPQTTSGKAQSSEHKAAREIAAPATRNSSPPESQRVVQAVSDVDIRFTCPRCEESLRIPRRYAGKRGECPRCGYSLQIPEEGQRPAPPREDCLVDDTCSEEDSRVLQLIETLASDDDWGQQKRAAEELGNMGARAFAAVPALIEALSDCTTHVQQAAAEALGKLGPDAADAIPFLITMLEDSRTYWAVRSSVIQALGGMGRLAQGATPSLLALLQDEHCGFWAEQALARIDPDAKAAAIESSKKAAIEAASRITSSYMSCDHCGKRLEEGEIGYGIWGKDSEFFVPGMGSVRASEVFGAPPRSPLGRRFEGAICPNCLKLLCESCLKDMGRQCPFCRDKFNLKVAWEAYIQEIIPDKLRPAFLPPAATNMAPRRQSKRKRSWRFR